MRIVSTLALLTLSLWLAPLVHAQPPGFTFEQIRIPGGPSENAVTGIAQDPQGFLWLATQGGLVKYDGYEFTTYTYNPFDSTSLSHDWVECLYVDRAGTLWVGTFGGGLNRFDRQTETFTRFQHDEDDSGSLSEDMVTAILEDGEGTLWVGTQRGLNRLDRERGTFTHFAHDPTDGTSLSNDQVRVVYEDRQGVLWVGTGSPWQSEPGAGGLNRFDRKTETFTRYLHDPGDAQSLIDNHVMALHEDSRGTFWVGTWGDGLHNMDRERGTFTRHRYDSHNPNRLSRPHLRSTAGGGSVPFAGVTFVQEDSSGAIWIGAYDGGLNRYDPATGTLLHFEADPVDPAVPRTDQIWRLYQSREGTLWLGTLAGLYRLAPAQHNFPHFTLGPATSDNAINDLHEDREGTLWIGTETGGLVRYDRETGAVRRYLPDPRAPSTLSSEQVWDIYEDRSGTLWVGTARGLNRLDRTRETFTNYLHDPDDYQSLSHDFISSIYEDRSGTLWIGTLGGGLNRMDRDSGTFTRYLPGSSRLSHPGNTIPVVSEDRSGGLWMGTAAGLYRFDRETGSFTPYLHDPSNPSSLSNNHVRSVYADRQGRLWIGTLRGGLNLFDAAAGTFTHFTAGNSGLPSNEVTSIVEDAAGTLWLSTGQGLVRFDPQTNTFQAYDLEHGLRTGWVDSGLLTRRGEVLFASETGFYAFFPAHVRETVNPHPPQLVLTDLQIFNKPVRPGPSSPLREALSETEGITLSHEEHDLTFGFAALHYSDPAKNRYAYMLEGYEDAWREVGTERRATYTNLDPGTYTFRVKAANSDGIWNEQGASLRVIILPPWWRTWWAYGLYVVLFCAAVFAVDRFQRRRIILKEREKALFREKELRAEAAENLANYLQSENERQMQELEHARKVQLSMLPHTLPEHPRVEIAAYMQTATEVGGDYYDFALSDDSTLTFAIGDATGHGVQAGTMVTAMKSLWNAFAQEPNLEQVMRKSSEALKRMHLPRIYMALAFGRLRDNILELVGAGMPPALIIRASTGDVAEVSLKGMPLGGPGRHPYRRQRVTLAPGDAVVLMSDGFPELRDASGSMLGYERMPQIVAEAAGRSPEGMIAHFTETIKARCDGHAPDDDVTFVVIRMKVLTKVMRNGDGKAVPEAREIEEPRTIGSLPG